MPFHAEYNSIFCYVNNILFPKRIDTIRSLTMYEAQKYILKPITFFGEKVENNKNS